ncbi:MAG: response regulator [Bacteroidia bacterium]|nr:response regulator [Bacteroidia bacterium]
MPTIHKALIIDDDEVNNFICVRQIRASSFAEQAEFILNGQDALHSLRTLITEDPDGLPDVIFLDINMPMMNAWEFLAEYDTISGKFPKPIKLFILSSSVYKKDVLKSLEHTTVEEYLFKPLTKDLLERIKTQYFS